MSSFVLVGASAEATGHPSSCTEPAPGSVQSTSSSSLSLNGTAIADTATADIHFNSHAHKYSDKDGDGTKECHDMQSHDVDPDSAKASDSVTRNGNKLYLQNNPVTSDPVSGGDVNITGTGGNGSLTENP